LIQEFHQVAGRSEIPFEEAYRDEFVPALTDGVRLLIFGWLPHGGGEGYEAVVLLAAEDIAAVDRHQDRLQRGDLAPWWSDREAQRYACSSTLHLPAPGTPIAQLDLTSIPTSAEDHGPRMLRLDVASVPRPARTSADALVESVEPSADGATCKLWGAWSSYFGDLEDSAVSLLYRIDDNARLEAVLAQDDPFHRWEGVADPSRLSDGAERRCRLLRTAPWSPLL
jgi:hypothetical protein